jgi:hypothetical protein
MDPKENVVKQINIYLQKALQRMVFSENCRSWYKGGRINGKVIGVWPGKYFCLAVFRLILPLTFRASRFKFTLL